MSRMNEIVACAPGRVGRSVYQPKASGATR
jgi:hypothetical protein